MCCNFIWQHISLTSDDLTPLTYRLNRLQVYFKFSTYVIIMPSTYKQISFLFSNLYNGLFHFITLLYWLDSGAGGGIKSWKKVTKWRSCLIPDINSGGYSLYLTITFNVSSGGRGGNILQQGRKVPTLQSAKYFTKYFSNKIVMEGSPFRLTKLMWSVRLPNVKSAWISGLNLFWPWCSMYFTYHWKLLIFPLEYLCLCL